MTDETVVNVNILDFFEEADDQGGSPFGVVCRAKLTTGYYAQIANGSKFFPVLDMANRTSVQNAARTYLESIGGKPNRGNPSFGFEFVRFKDGYLNVSPPKWDGDSFTNIFSSRRFPTGKTNDKGQAIFDTNPDYQVFSQGIKDIGEDANEYIGREIYVHYVNIPDPTFNQEDESTQKTREDTDMPGPVNCWMGADGNKVPNMIPKIVALFKTEEEAVAYLEEHGESADASENEASGGVDALFEQVSGQVEMPDGFLTDEMWEEADYPDLLKGLVTALVSGKEVKEVVKDYAETPMDKKFIANVAKLVKEG